MSFCDELNKLLVHALPRGYGFSLPTEAQWEYACRAGTQTVYHSGNSLADLSKVAWHGGNSSEHPHPVGEKEPNAWGLYDMHGNIGEWCYDVPSDYPDAPAVDWVGKETVYDLRCNRGGAWSTRPSDPIHRCSCRCWLPPEWRLVWLGFRLALRVTDESQGNSRMDS
jgi:formylglycine-generating enzyme required for sulfatase activity